MVTSSPKRILITESQERRAVYGELVELVLTNVAGSTSVGKGNENPEYIKAMRQIRRSNAAGTHQDKRSRRKRTRKAGKDASIRDQEG